MWLQNLWNVFEVGFGTSGPLVSPPIKEGESETGNLLSAIFPGKIIITNPDNQQQNIDGLRRDTTDTNTSLPGIPDFQKLLSEQPKTQQLYDDSAAQAAKMIGDYTVKRAEEALKSGNVEEYAFWARGRPGPNILHAIAGGLLGGVTDFNGTLSGMLGGFPSSYLAHEIENLVGQFVQDAGLTGSAADLMVNTITGSILQRLGATTGGAGAAYAGNAYQYNIKIHRQIEGAIRGGSGAGGKANVTTAPPENAGGVKKIVKESTSPYDKKGTRLT